MAAISIPNFIRITSSLVQYDWNAVERAFKPDTSSFICAWYDKISVEMAMIKPKHIIWATSWQNLFMPYVNNKDADQPAHPCSLISTFIVHCLDSIIPILSKFKISRLASFWSRAGQFESYLAANPRRHFPVTWLNYSIPPCYISGFADAALDPIDFPTAPAFAIPKVSMYHQYFREQTFFSFTISVRISGKNLIKDIWKYGSWELYSQFYWAYYLWDNTISPTCDFNSRTDKKGIWWYLRNNFAYFSIKTYVVGTH